MGTVDRIHTVKIRKKPLSDINSLDNKRDKSAVHFECFLHAPRRLFSVRLSAVLQGCRPYHSNCTESRHCPLQNPAAYLPRFQVAWAHLVHIVALARRRAKLLADRLG